MSSMGHIAVEDPTHVCDNCEATYTGTTQEIGKQGWDRKKVAGNGGWFTLCGDCVQDFKQRRDLAKALNA